MNIEPTASLPTAKAAVTGAIRNAAQVTGADFQYLLATARVESNLNAQAAAPTSTAKGLFQFISQTWLQTLKEQGPALGYGRYADAIDKLPSGQYGVRDPKLQNQIMNLRSDAVASATMAGAFTKANAAKLSSWLGRAPSEGELYVAHFLGAGGAAKLIDLAETKPQTPAASAFPGAATANSSIFFNRQGQPRSAADVYRTLVGRYDVARANVPARLAPATTVAKALPAVPATPAHVAPRAPPPGASHPVLDTAQLAQVTAVVPKPPVPPVAPAMPVFHGLFRTSENQPVAPVVNALWGTQPAQAAPPAATAPPPQPAPVARPGSPLDLFQEQPPDARALFRGRV